MGYGVAQIDNKEKMIEFLKKDEAAKNLAAAAVAYPALRPDLEVILTDVCQGRFENTEKLHSLIDENTNDIYTLIEEGVTSLGSYIGKYSREDKSIVPVLLGQAIEHIPEDRITPSLEERLVRILRVSHSPAFSQYPTQLIAQIDEKIRKSNGKVTNLYRQLRKHYQEVLDLGAELG